MKYTLNEIGYFFKQVAHAYQQVGFDLALDAQGLPDAIQGVDWLDVNQAAVAFETACLQPVLSVVPALATDWTHTEQASTPINIERVLSVLQRLQLLSGEALNNPVTHAAYSSLLMLCLAQACVIRYESIEQSIALRQALHAHVDYLARELLKEVPQGAVVASIRDCLVLADEAAEQQAATLPHAIKITLQRAQPVLSVMWERLNHSDVDDFLTRNQVIHPLFVPADTDLELLR